MSSRLSILALTLVFAVVWAQPAVMPGASGSVIAAGGAHSLVVLHDGSVRSWGMNRRGQVGDGSLLDRHVPVTVQGASNVRAVAAGYEHSLALLADGRVMGWGWNGFGQLGDLPDEVYGSATIVPGVSTAAIVAAGYHHSLALLSDGTVVAWGWNDDGQLGDGSTTTRRAPVQVRLPAGVRSVAAGDTHTLAHLSDGTVMAWGGNAYGQLGDGTTTRRVVPTRVPGLSDVQAIAAGRFHSLALLRDGSVVAWGWNSSGQLGDGTTTDRLAPQPVLGVTNAAHVTAGDAHTAVALRDGGMLAWGWNGLGQLGEGSAEDQRSTVAVVAITNANAVTAGWAHTLALLDDGTVMGWGWNETGVLGDGTTETRSVPSAVTALAGVPTGSREPVGEGSVSSGATTAAITDIVRLYSSPVPESGFPDALAFSPDGARLFFGIEWAPRGFGVVLDTRDWARVDTFSFHPMRSAAFAPDSVTLYFGGEIGLVFARDTVAQHSWDVFLLEDNRPRTAFDHDWGFRLANRVGPYAFDEDGRWFALADERNTVHVQRLSDGGSVATSAFGERVRALALGPDGGIVIASGSQVYVLDVNSGARELLVDLGRPVNHVIGTADGSLLAASGDDGQVHVLRQGATRSTLVIDTGEANHRYAVSPTGTLLAALGETVRLWSLPDGRALGQLASDGRVAMGQLSFSADGRFLAVYALFEEDAPRESVLRLDVYGTEDGGPVFAERFGVEAPPTSVGAFDRRFELDWSEGPWSAHGVHVPARSSAGVEFVVRPAGVEGGWWFEVTLAASPPVGTDGDAWSGDPLVAAFPFGVLSLAVPEPAAYVDYEGIELRVWNRRTDTWDSLKDAYASPAPDVLQEELRRLAVQVGFDVYSVAVPWVQVVNYLMLVAEVLAEYGLDPDVSTMPPSGASFEDANRFRVVQRPWRLTSDRLDLREHVSLEQPVMQLQLRVPVSGLTEAEALAVAPLLLVTTELTGFWEGTRSQPTGSVGAIPEYPPSVVVPRPEGMRSISGYVVHRIDDAGFRLGDLDASVDSAWVEAAQLERARPYETPSEPLSTVGYEREWPRSNERYEVSAAFEAVPIGPEDWWLELHLEGAPPLRLDGQPYPMPRTLSFPFGLAYVALPNLGVQVHDGSVEFQLFDFEAGAWETLTPRLARSMSPGFTRLSTQVFTDVLEKVIGKALGKTVAYGMSVATILDELAGVPYEHEGFAPPEHEAFYDANRYRVVEFAWRLEDYLEPLASHHRFIDPKTYEHRAMRARVRMRVSGLSAAEVTLSQAYLAHAESYTHWQASSREDFVRGGLVFQPTGTRFRTLRSSEGLTPGEGRGR